MEAHLHHVSILEDMYLDCPIRYSYVVTPKISCIVYAPITMNTTVNYQ
jgi:hypothetical protein